MQDPYSHKAIRHIAIPMILSSITVPLLGMVDTAVMGHLDDAAYLGAVAAGATIFSVLFMGLNFLRMGTTGITAQAYGAGDNETIRTSLGQPILVALCLSGIILAIQGPLLDSALWILSPSTEVGQLTRTYFTIRVWSAPFSLVNFVLIGWLIGMQNARGPLIIMLVINLTNIVLDLVFVLLLGMTVNGVALATLLSEFSGVIVAVLFVRARLSSYPGQWVRSKFIDPANYRRLFDVNASLFLRTMALMFVFAFITARGARMGNVILATNALLMNFQLFQSYALDGIAYAAEALVGKAVGGRDHEGVRNAVRRTLQWSLIVAGAFCIVYAVAGQAIIATLTNIDDLRMTAREFLPWLIISPLISVWSYLYDGVYVGATRTREMMLIMAGSTVLVFLPIWFITTPFGNHGLWLAFTAFMLARGIGMHVWFRRMINGPELVPNLPAATKPGNPDA
jgi:MATE family multidrug resistance protein